MWFLTICIILMIIVFLCSYLMFHLIFYRPKRSTKVPSFYLDSPHYKVSRAGMAIMDTLPCKHPSITSFDGLKLEAYFYPAKQDQKRFVLGIHGYRSYARPEYGPYIEFYRSLGFHMLLPNDRAHAPSEGSYIGFGVLDRLDCIAWAQYLVDTYGEDIEILLHGVSMGAATVLAASGEQYLPKQVIGIVADCGFTSPWDAISYQLKHGMHIPVYPFLPICEKICKYRAGFDLHQFAAIDQVKKATTPILFVQGGKDKMVPAFMAQQLYDACASRKQLLMIEDAGHAESIALAPEAYHQAILSFFHILG